MIGVQRTARRASRRTSRPATATPIRPPPPSPSATTSPSAPDGKYLVFTAVPDEGRGVEHQLRHLPRAGHGRRQEWETLTKDNPAADSGPQFSPDGKRLAYRAQKRAGLRGRPVGADGRGRRTPGGAFKGKPRSLTDGSSTAPSDEFVWVGRRSGSVFTADDGGARRHIPILAASTEPVRRALAHGPRHRIARSRPARTASVLAFTRAAMNHPAEVCRRRRSTD